MDQRKVETFQRRATKLVTSLQENDYDTRLMELRLPLLNYCHQPGDMILVYQILNFNSLVDTDTNNLFTQSSGIKPKDTNKNLQVSLFFFTLKKYFSYHVVNT